MEFQVCESGGETPSQHLDSNSMVAKHDAAIPQPYKIIIDDLHYFLIKNSVQLRYLSLKKTNNKCVMVYFPFQITDSYIYISFLTFKMCPSLIHFM